MSTLEDQVKQALAPVEDPATGRALVKGQLREVSVTDAGAKSVTLHVDLVSPGYPQRDELESAIRGALAPLELGEVSLQWGLAVPHKPARQDKDRLPTVKTVLAVAAGKGGVGKSTVSVNLAMSLKAMGAKVGILDADIYGPSVPKMLGTAERETATAEDGKGIAPAIYRGMPVMSVAYFVEAGQAVIWRGPMIHKLLTQFLEDVQWGDLDYLIVDLPPGTGDAQLSLGQLIPITGALMVTTPQEIALLDVRKAVDMFGKLEVPVLGVVENMSFFRCDGCGQAHDIFGAGGGKRLAEEYDIPLFGKIPIEARIGHGGESGVPVVEAVPDSETAEAFRDVAAKTTLASAKLQATGPRRSSMLRTV